MSEFNRKNKYSFWHSPIILVLLFCLLFFFIYSIINLIEKERETHNKKEIILSNIEDLRNREKILLRDIEKLKTEEGTEEVIRDKYKVARVGEKMVMIVEKENTESEIVEPLKNNYSFWGWIKKKLGIIKN